MAQPTQVAGTLEDTSPDKAHAVGVSRTSAGLRDWMELVRPSHWVKNVVVLAGPAAGLKLLSFPSLWEALVAFGAFCLTASATYAINDVADYRADARHPMKRLRPIARGAIRPVHAVLLGAILFALAVSASTLLLNHRVTVVLVLYFALTLSYSLALKRRMILDVILLASGFVLRALAGALAVSVATSQWLVACVFTLCLFMGFGKRRAEIAMIANEDEARAHRGTLARYTPDLLNQLISVSAAIAVITFLLYTLESGGPAPPFHKEHLFFTLPLVVYGVFRFAMLTELGVYSGPTEIVLKDKALLATILVWAMIALLIAYEGSIFGPGGLESLLGTGVRVG